MQRISGFSEGKCSPGVPKIVQRHGNVAPGHFITYTKNGSATGHHFENGTCHCGVVEAVMGDVTGDGKLNMGDVARLYAAARGTAQLEDAVTALSDINGDGKLNMGDVAKLFRQIKSA